MIFEICRICLADLRKDSYKISLNSVELLEKHIQSACSELDLRIAWTKLVCRNCFTFINIIASFIKKFNDSKENAYENYIFSQTSYLFEDLNSMPIKSEEIELPDADEYNIGLSSSFSITEFNIKKCKYESDEIEIHNSETINNVECLQYSQTCKQEEQTQIQEKTFKCSQCDFSCKQKSYFKTHIFSHSDRKPFRCSLCNYSCILRHNLKNHMRTHTGEKPFHCSFCRYSCNQKGNLKNHIRTHTGEKPFLCSICNYRSTQKGHIVNHIRRYHIEIKFNPNNYIQKCNSKLHNIIKKELKCSDAFDLCQKKIKEICYTSNKNACNNNNLCNSRVKKSTLKINSSIHKEEKLFQCAHCFYSSKLKRILKMHINQVHNRKQSLKCAKCYYSTIRKHSLIEHMSIHIGKNTIQCTYNDKQESCMRNCTYLHTEEKLLNLEPQEETYFKDSHYNNAPENGLNQIKIQNSTKMKINSNSNKINTKLHGYFIRSRQEKKKKKCLHCTYSCEQKLITKTEYKKQNNEVPTEKHQHQASCNDWSNSSKRNLNLCTIKNYAKDAYLNFLSNSDSGEKIRLLKCSQCNFSTSTKKELEQHCLRHTFRCSKCSYYTAQKNKLKKHLLTHRKNVFKCSYCKYKCKHKSMLKHHTSIHTGRKQFRCTQCYYSCSQKGNLKNHLRTHTGEKPFHCQECDYKCAQKVNLDNHIRIHTGEKPFKCSQCNYKSSQKGNLSSHVIRIHTREDLLYCFKCKYTCKSESLMKQHMWIHKTIC